MYKDIQQRQHFCDNGDLETNYISTSKKKKKKDNLKCGICITQHNSETTYQVYNNNMDRSQNQC